MKPNIMVPYLQFRSRSVVAYSLPDRAFTPPPPKPTRTYTGVMTPSAMKRIRRLCDILVQRSPERHVWNPITNQPVRFRLTFATLTISQQTPVSAPDAYTLGLSPLLRWLRRSCGVVDYIWKLEFQQRGQIHYHVTLNQFVRYDYLRKEWNHIQRVAGWLDDFNSRFGHWNPNSTDIHAVRQVHKIDLYLAKYLAKGTGGQAIKGKVWGCSKSLSGKRFFSVVASGQTEANVYTASGGPAATVRRLDHATVIELPNPAGLLAGDDARAYQSWLVS